MATQNPYDVVVVGAGLAGSVAAAAAVEAGRSVLILERSSATPGWSNSLISGGVLHTAFRDPRGDPDEMYDHMLACTDGNANPPVARAWAGNATSTLRWLEDHGATLIADGNEPMRARVFSPVKPMIPGLDFDGFGMQLFLLKLAQLVTGSGGTIMHGARATKLGRADGVWELTIGTEQGTSVVAARSAILCDGGFQANPELLRRYVGTDQLKLRATDTGTGDGLLMGLSAGATIVNMSAFYGHLLCRDAMSNDGLWPYPLLDPLARAGIVVNGEGRRVVDEGISGVTTANHLAWSPTPLDNWVVFDNEAWEGPAQHGAIPPNPFIAERGGTVLIANSIDDLADQMNLDRHALAQSIADGAGGSTGSGVERTHPVTISAPPFYAIPLAVGVTFTMGGLAVDGDGRVLDERGAPIEGLYAAGGTMGGLHGGPNAGYGGGLLEAAIFGLLAGSHAGSS